jgi:hypothetical protein
MRHRVWCGHGTRRPVRPWVCGQRLCAAACSVDAAHHAAYVHALAAGSFARSRLGSVRHVVPLTSMYRRQKAMCRLVWGPCATANRYALLRLESMRRAVLRTSICWRHYVAMFGVDAAHHAMNVHVSAARSYMPPRFGSMRRAASCMSMCGQQTAMCGPVWGRCSNVRP